MFNKVNLGKLSSSSTRVILVRHGRSTYNDQGRYQGNCDTAVLTKKGLDSAYQTGLALNQFLFDAIYTSPLQRTQQTAREILRALSSSSNYQPPVVTNSKLQELPMHQWEGLTFNEVKEKFSQAYHCWKHTPHLFEMNVSTEKNAISRGNLALATTRSQKCLPVIELYQQAKQFWQEILPHHLGKTILVVSHSGTNRALISTAVGFSPSSFHGLQQCNCGISMLEFNSFPSLSARLENLNLSTHLKPKLPKLKEGNQGLRLILLPTKKNDLSGNKRVAKFLKDTHIDFCISAENNSPVTNQVLQYHPGTLQLELQRENFLQVWQQAIATICNRDSCLTTGLVMGFPERLKRLITLFLGNDNFSVYPDAISVIHYPQVNQTPILQALNIKP